jgi:hypothetical protein
MKMELAWRQREQKDGGEMEAEEGVIRFPIRSPFTGGFGEEHVTARRVMLAFTFQQTSFP